MLLLRVHESLMALGLLDVGNLMAVLLVRLGRQRLPLACIIVAWRLLLELFELFVEVLGHQLECLFVALACLCVANAANDLKMKEGYEIMGCICCFYLP